MSLKSFFRILFKIMVTKKNFPGRKLPKTWNRNFTSCNFAVLGLRTAKASKLRQISAYCFQSESAENLVLIVFVEQTFLFRSSSSFIFFINVPVDSFHPAERQLILKIWILVFASKSSTTEKTKSSTTIDFVDVKTRFSPRVPAWFFRHHCSSIDVSDEWEECWTINWWIFFPVLDRQYLNSYYLWLFTVFIVSVFPVIPTGFCLLNPQSRQFRKCNR